MKTSCKEHAAYIGVDLTDGYAKTPRAADVCGLDPVQGRLRARFWQWTYDGGVADVADLLPEIRAARGAVLDGPQALARVGAPMRECERLLAAPGKTPSSSPASGPFAGFIRTSVDLFAAFDAVGISVSSGALTGGVAEQYPGGNWRRLVRGLPSKKRPEGIHARRLLLQALGVDFPDDLRLKDDHLDACLGAVIAAAADGRVAGAHVERIGLAMERDGTRLREGPILLLGVDGETADRLRQAVGPLEVVRPVPRLAAGKRPGDEGPPLVRIGVTTRLIETNTDAIAVEGLSHLKANKNDRHRVDLPEYGGHLCLGDHGLFWASHQLEDPVAHETYKKVRAALLATPDDYDDVDALVDGTRRDIE